jgi:hypothetical protein
MPDHRSPTAQVLGVIAVFVVLRLVLSRFVGLGTDESYTVAVARDLHLSYFDHPPMQYWLVHGLGAAFGYGRVSRLPFIALFAGSSWLMFVLTRRLFGERAGVWAVLGLNLSAFFTFAAGSWVLPDGPLVFFLLGAAAALGRLWFPRASEAPRPWADWLIFGAWLGLAALSKYQAALFAVGAVLAVLTVDRRRDYLRHPAPYVAALLCLAILSPVVIWNAGHGWASFAFQSGRGAPNHGLRLLGPLVALAAQAVLLLPWIFWPMARAAAGSARAGAADERRWFCLMLAAPAIAVFTLMPLVSPLGLPHWSMPGWLLLFPLLGERLATAAGLRRRWPRAWLIVSVLVVALGGALALSDAATGWAGGAYPKLFKRGDPTVETLEWTGVRTELQRRGKLGAGTPLLIAPQWNEAGKLDEAVGDVATVMVFSPDQREFAFRHDAAAFIGRDALVVGKLDSLNKRLPELRGYFHDVSADPPIVIGRDGHPELTIGVIEARGLLRPYPQGLARKP